jgi:phage-related protein
MAETLGASFTIDTTDLKAGLAQANRLIRESESEFRAAAAGLDDWTESEEGVSAKIKSLNSVTDLQRKKVNALQAEYDRLIAEGLDPSSKQATELRTKINEETASLRKNEAELKKQNQALEELADGSKKAGDATADMGEKFSGLKAAGGIAVGAIAAVGAACAGAVTAFFGLAESTREYRQDMAQLAQNAKDSGADLDAMKDKLAEVSAVTGEADAAMEGMNMLMATGLDTSQIEIASDALAGAAMRFDGLKFEGIAEGLQETLATGVAVGPFAELIERTGGDLEAFNAGLANCTTEAEKQAYTMKFLTESGLVEANAEYKEMNKDLYEAEMAQHSLNETLAELGAIAEPIMTTLKNLAGELLQSITPFVSLIGEGLKGAFEGADGAADMLAEGLTGILSTLLDKIVTIAPFVIETITAIVPKLLTSILEQLPTILATLLSMVSQVATSLGQMLPTLIPVIIDAVIMCAETLLDNVDMIIDAGISLLVGLADGLIVALPRLVDKIPVIIEKLIGALSRNLPKLVEAGIQLTVKLAAGLIQAVPQLVSKIPQIISSVVSGFADYYSRLGEVGANLIRGLWEGIKNMTSWIKKKIEGFGESVVEGLKDFFGIHSPSRVMSDEVGKNLALGIGEGFEKNIGAVNDEITDAMNFDDPNFPARSGGLGVVRSGGIVQNNYFKQAYTSQKEKYKAQQQLLATVRLAKVGV